MTKCGWSHSMGMSRKTTSHRIRLWASKLCRISTELPALTHTPCSMSFSLKSYPHGGPTQKITGKLDMLFLWLCHNLEKMWSSRLRWSLSSNVPKTQFIMNILKSDTLPFKCWANFPTTWSQTSNNFTGHKSFRLFWVAQKIRFLGFKATQWLHWPISFKIFKHKTITFCNLTSIRS